MKKLIVGTAALLMSLPTFAGGVFDIDPVEDWTYTIGYNVFTSHTSSVGYTDKVTRERVPYNETNKIVMVKVNLNDNLAVGVGKGENSYFKDTNIIGVEFHTNIDPEHKFDIGSDIVLASGYEHVIDGGILPAVNPFLRYNQKLSDCVTVSGKVGAAMFMAINGFVELTFDF